MKECPVSVILPFYKAEETICRAVQSVLDQTRPVAEILCIHDGSPDKSLQALKTFIDRQSEDVKQKIKIVDLGENRGVYTARNLGLEKVSQPYVAFLDADDFWHPEKIERQFRALEEDPDIFFLCHRVDVWPERTPKAFSKCKPGVKIRSINKHKVLWLSRLRTISVVMKKTGKYKFDESKKRGGDQLLWLEVIWSGEKAVFIDETLAWKGKPHYGAGGLSGDLWAAEKEAQHSLTVLAARDLISKPYAAFLRAWFFIKFLKRTLVSMMRHAGTLKKHKSVNGERGHAA